MAALLTNKEKTGETRNSALLITLFFNLRGHGPIRRWRRRLVAKCSGGNKSDTPSSSSAKATTFRCFVPYSAIVVSINTGVRWRIWRG
ncbi:hypothetical protein KCP69_22650 [Salmonella enterica subsp. enterica]|nr:hypothetical protein KCP69_22650 [Salmonella enterica subsp. enterica]